jgi:CelD/BcsL family acetyltransferase involved in cellulose biosynthesis
MTADLAIAPALTATPHAFTARRLDMDDPFLAEFAAPANVFQSRRHIETAIRTMGTAEGVEPVLVGVRDDAGKAVALFPFVLRRQRGVRVIEGLDFDLTDYFAPALTRGAPLSPDETDSLWKTVCKALPPADAISFKKTPLRFGDHAHALTAFRRLRPMGAEATTLPLHPGFDAKDTSASRDARRKLRKLEGMGKVTFSMAVGDGIEAALQELVAFRLARFAELGRPDLLARPEAVDFYRSMAVGDDAPGRIFTLRVDDEAIAAIYAFAVHGTFTLIIPAISPDTRWHVGSPGLVTLYKALEWSVAENCRVFDLSVGSMYYKTRFGAGTVELFEYQKMLTPLGAVVVAEAWARRTVRRIARRHPRVRTVLQQIVAQLSRGRSPHHA